MIDKFPRSNNKVELNFNSTCLKRYPETGTSLYNGACEANLSSFKVNARIKPEPTTTPLATASVNYKFE